MLETYAFEVKPKQPAQLPIKVKPESTGWSCGCRSGRVSIPRRAFARNVLRRTVR